MIFGLEDIDLLIVRYLDGVATFNEKQLLYMWIMTSQDNKHYFVRFVRVWEQSHILIQDESLASESFIRFDQLIFKKKIRKTIYTVSTAVAITLLAILVRFLIPSTDVQLLSVETNNQKKEVVLPDGSIIWLNRNSQIQYPQDFVLQRKVHLSGEAYFDVVHIEGQPFYVETTNLSIRVIGTQFLITDRTNEKKAEAILESGMVQLTALKTGEEFLLHPGQILSYDGTIGNSRLEFVETIKFTNWINSRLVFENTPLKDVFFQLEKWYDIQIVCVDNAILQTHVSFTLDSETSEEIMALLQVIVPFTWTEVSDLEQKKLIITVV